MNYYVRFVKGRIAYLQALQISVKFHWQLLLSSEEYLEDLDLNVVQFYPPFQKGETVERPHILTDLSTVFQWALKDLQGLPWFLNDLSVNSMVSMVSIKFKIVFQWSLREEDFQWTLGDLSASAQRSHQSFNDLSTICQQTHQFWWTLLVILWFLLVAAGLSESTVNRTMSAQWSFNGCCWVSQRSPSRGVDPFFGMGGGGGARVREKLKSNIFGAVHAQNRNIKLCARSSRQTWKLCMFSSILC